MALAGGVSIKVAGAGGNAATLASGINRLQHLHPLRRHPEALRRGEFADAFFADEEVEHRGGILRDAPDFVAGHRAHEQQGLVEFVGIRGAGPRFLADFFDGRGVEDAETGIRPGVACAPRINRLECGAPQVVRCRGRRRVLR